MGEAGNAGLFASLLVSLIGTFARTALIAGGATLLMLVVRSRRKIVTGLIIAATGLVLLEIAPGNWFDRMQLITDYQNDGSAMSRMTPGNGGGRWPSVIRSSAAGSACLF